MLFFLLKKVWRGFVWVGFVLIMPLIGLFAVIKLKKPFFDFLLHFAHYIYLQEIKQTSALQKSNCLTLCLCLEFDHSMLAKDVMTRNTACGGGQHSWL